MDFVVGENIFSKEFFGHNIGWKPDIYVFLIYKLNRHNDDYNGRVIKLFNIK